MKKIAAALLLSALQVFCGWAFADEQTASVIRPTAASKVASFVGEVALTSTINVASNPGSRTKDVKWYASTDGKTWFCCNDRIWEFCKIAFAYDSFHTMNSTLTVFDLKEAMHFKCTIDDPDGKTVSSGIWTVTVFPRTQVDVGSPERFVFNGADKAFKDADCRAKLTARASGKAPFKYQWYEIVGGKKQPIKNAKAATYTTPRITDFGKQYMVEVSNSLGTVESEPITISQASAPEIVTQPVDAFCGDKNSGTSFCVIAAPSAGDNAKIQWQRCDAGKDPSVEKNWKNAGAGIMSASNKSGVLNSLHIKNPSAKFDGAGYRCVVSNSAGSVVSDKATLTVYSSAKITAQPKPATVIAGNEFELTCAATGSNVLYIWEKSTDNGKTWTEVQRGEIGTLKITLDEVQNAKFRCKAQGRTGHGENIGSAASSAAVAVTVNEPAKIDDILVTQLGDGVSEVYLEYPFELKAVASGKAIKYQWFESTDGVDFKEIRGAKAAIYKVAKNKYKEVAHIVFKCEVSNKFGAQTSSASKAVAVELKNPVLPASFDGIGMSLDYIDEEFDYGACFFPDKSSARLIGWYTCITKDSKYTYKRTSPITADFSITFSKVISGKLQKPKTYKFEIYYDKPHKMLRNKSTGKANVISSLYPPDYPAPKANELKNGMAFKFEDLELMLKITDVKKRKFEAIDVTGSVGAGTYTYTVKSNIAMLTLKFDYADGLSGKLLCYVTLFFEGEDPSGGSALAHKEYTLSDKSRQYATSFDSFRLLTTEEAAEAESKGGNLVIISGAQTGGKDIALGAELDLDLGDYIDFGDIDGDLVDLGGGDGKTVDFEEGEIPGYLTPIGK